MITCLGMTLSIIALVTTFIVCIIIMCKIISWMDNHIGSEFLTCLTVVLGGVITCFTIGFMGVECLDRSIKWQCCSSTDNIMENILQSGNVRKTNRRTCCKF